MSCQKTSFLLEKEQLTELKFREKMAIKWHFMMCKWCKNYGNDSRALGRMLKRMSKKSEDRVLADHEKRKLKEALEAAKS